MKRNSLLSTSALAKSLALILAATFAIASYAGQVYKWVDENGNTQFSQFPPSEEQKSEQVNVKTQKSSSAAKEKLNASRQKLLESSVDRNTDNEQDKLDKEKAERMAENCEKAKQQLRDLQNNGRIYKTLENGERHWFDEKERQQQINRAQDQVKKYCQ